MARADHVRAGLNHPLRGLHPSATAISLWPRATLGSCHLDVFMNRDPRFALSQEVEAKQTLLDQLRALAADDPVFFTDLTEQKPAA